MMTGNTEFLDILDKTLVLITRFLTEGEQRDDVNNETLINVAWMLGLM